MIGNDLQLKQHVEDELTWEPTINPAAVGVSVQDAVVTLSGHVDSYAQKQAAAETVTSIRGVRAVANELEVRLPAESERNDADIAHAVASIFSWNSLIPKDRIHVEVRHGWVTLEGRVKWAFERALAGTLVKDMMGVKGVTNAIGIGQGKPSPNAAAQLRAALKRNFAKHEKLIRFDVNETTLVLSGTAPTPAVSAAIECIAWKTPGIVFVDNQIEVIPALELVGVG